MTTLRNGIVSSGIQTSPWAFCHIEPPAGRYGVYTHHKKQNVHSMD